MGEHRGGGLRQGICCGAGCLARLSGLARCPACRSRHDGDFTIVADLPKRIAWDQNKLANMADRIRAAGEDPSEYIDAAFKVPERKYTAWPEYLRRDFEPARTVKPGTLKVELIAQEVDQ
jgi:hypothetical protein